MKPWLSPQHREGDGERKSDPVFRNSIEEKKHRGIPHCILFQKGREIYKKYWQTSSSLTLKKNLSMLHRSLEIFVLQLKCTKISFPLFRSSTIKVFPFFLALSGGLVWRLAQSGLWFDGQVIVPLTCLARTKSAPLFSRPEELECTPLPPSPSSPSSLSFPFPSSYFPPSCRLPSPLAALIAARVLHTLGTCSITELRPSSCFSETGSPCIVPPSNSKSL